MGFGDALWLSRVTGVFTVGRLSLCSVDSDAPWHDWTDPDWGTFTVTRAGDGLGAHVVFQAYPVSTVPEAGTWSAGTGLGLLAAGALLRRRRA